jgi:hypothetical protein
MSTPYSSNDVQMQIAEDNVYNEVIRKSCNIRIDEFISSQKQRIAAVKGNASTAGQNLRDSLLTNHVKLQSHIKIN